MDLIDKVLVDHAQDLERQLEEVQKENIQLKEMREHLKWKDETRKEKERLERQLIAMEEICYEFYSAGLTAGHPMTTAQSAEREYDELKKELRQLKE